MTITPTKTAAQNAAIRSPVSRSPISRAHDAQPAEPIRKNTVFSSRNWMVAQLTRR
jgi:hypothetical protein